MVAVFKDEANLQKVGIVLDPRDPSKAMPLEELAELRPDDTWPDATLIAFGLKVWNGGEKDEQQAAAFARKSIRQRFRAAGAFFILRGRLKGEKEWCSFQEKHNLPRTKLWETIAVFERAMKAGHGEEDVVEFSTWTEVMVAYGITKPRESSPEGSGDVPAEGIGEPEPCATSATTATGSGEHPTGTKELLRAQRSGKHASRTGLPELSSHENNDEVIEPEDEESGSGIVEGSAQVETEVHNEPDDDDQQDDRAAAASGFIGLFGNDIQQAIAYLIEHHWNKADAIKWLTAWAERTTTKPPDAPWPPLIACGEVPPWEKAKAGQYVTWGGSRVMVIDAIRDSELVLEDPFHPKGKYPIAAIHEEWDQVFATTEEYVTSEFVRLKQKIPTEKSPKNRTTDKKQAAQNKPTPAKTPANKQRANDSRAGITQQHQETAQ